VDKR
jgi:hypothetical protein